MEVSADFVDRKTTTEPKASAPRHSHQGGSRSTRFKERKSASRDDGLSQVNPTRPEEEEEKVRRGREAFQHLRRTWEDWKAVGGALAIGSAESLLKANSNEPRGTRYQKAMGDWLIENGFKGIDKGVRSRLLKCIDHLDEIERWRATLTEPDRIKYNCPNTVWRRWNARGKAPSPTSSRKKSPFAKLKESVQQLEDKNYSLEQQIKTAPKVPDIGLYLPAKMAPELVERLKEDIARLKEKYGLRCKWDAPLSANDGGDNA